MRADETIIATVHVSVFGFTRSLPCCQIRQVRHEPLDETFKEGHHQYELQRSQPSDKCANRLQVLVDRHSIHVGWVAPCSYRKASEHARMIVSHFFQEIVFDNLLRFG